MDLYEYLDTYKTSPANEIHKVDKLLEAREYVGFAPYTLREALDNVYRESDFSSFEPSFNDFASNLILCDFENQDLHGKIASYRYYCEFLIALLDSDLPYSYEEAFNDDIDQLRRVIDRGLEKSGYVWSTRDGRKVTKKKDDVAEAIANRIPEYSKNIFDYLLAKGADEKEKVLTALSIQLEAKKPKGPYSKAIGEYVQLLRHKNEKNVDEKYNWFFAKQDYESNLDKLFRILLSSISYDGAYDAVSEFNTKAGK